MGGGLKKEYCADPLPGYDASASDPWPDFFDLNYTLSKPAGGEELTYGSNSSSSISSGLGSLESNPFEKPKLSRYASDPIRDPESPSGPSALRPMPSMPISTHVELSAKASLPFDFDDFLATLKTDEPEPEDEVPQPSGSRFKQFFDTASSPIEKTKLCQQSSDSRLLKVPAHDPIPPFAPLLTCGVPLQQSNQHPTTQSPDQSQLPKQQPPHPQLTRPTRRLPKGQLLCRSFSSPHSLESPIEPIISPTLLSPVGVPNLLSPVGVSPLLSPVGVASDFDCHDLDDITDADMVAANICFNTIKEASLASSMNEKAVVQTPPEERPPVSPPHVEREQAPQPQQQQQQQQQQQHQRPRFKNHQGSNNSRWSPPAATVNTSPPTATMATAALLQARLLAQQRAAAAAATGLFPGGQVAQLVRPPMPVYQTGLQTGLPMQSAALLYLYM